MVQGDPTTYTAVGIIQTANNENLCGNPIPAVSECGALIVLILNIFWPGLGTVILGLIGYQANCCAFFCLGLLQFILAPVLLIGWIWAICTGCSAMRVAAQPPQNAAVYIAR